MNASDNLPDVRPLTMWSLTEAHEQTNISRDELYRLCRNGTLQSITTGEKGGMLMIRAASLIAYLTEQRQPQESNVRQFQARKDERRI